MSATPIRADARRLPLADESVDLIITSPPYFALRSYRDGGEHYEGQVGSEPTPQAFLEALWAVTKECWRVLKPTGSLFVNLGDKRSGSGGHNNSGLASGQGIDRGKKQCEGCGETTDRKRCHNSCGAKMKWVSSGGSSAVPATRRNAPDRYTQAAFGRPKSKMLLPHRFAIGCEDGLADPDGVGWIVRQDIVWSKPSALPESVTDRTRDSHEYWFQLVKQGRYFSAVDEIRSARPPGTITEWTGDNDSCPRCGKPTAAGRGREAIRLPGTGSSGSTVTPPSLIDSATPSTSAPSLTGSSLTTYAATEDASDRTILSPSLFGPTFSEATPSPPPTLPKPSAATGTPSMRATRTALPTGAGCAECVCGPETGRATGERSRNEADQPGPTGSRHTAAHPLGSLPGSVWTIPSEPLTLPDAVKAHYDLPDHFAAFPQEFPRRLILGWSPSGVCVACGEGRRPVVAKDTVQEGPLRNRTRGPLSLTDPHDRASKGCHGSGAEKLVGHTEATITGYACACPDTSAPTRKAVVVDVFGGTGTVAGVARQLGRLGLSFDLSYDYSRLAQWFLRDGRRFAKSASRTDAERQGVLL